MRAMAGLLRALAALVALCSVCGALRPAEEASLLLAASKSWTNWPAALDSPACRAAPGLAWSTDTLPCGTSAANSSWRGVGCNADGQVAELSLPGCGLTGSLPPELASLPHLQTIDLSHNALAGGIPKSWTAIGGLPALQTLQLANNSLVGGLTDFTPVATGFISSLYFNISRNHLNQSTIPPDWYSKTLALLDLSFNNITSTLPPEWGYPKDNHESEYPSAFPSLARLAIEGNNISGPFDPWPGGGATVFSPNFLCTGKPGNPYLLKAAPPPALNSGSGSGGLSGGAIAGIVVGSVAAAALAAGLVVFVVRRRRRQRAAVTAAAGDAEKGGTGGSGDDLKGAGTSPPTGPAGGAPNGSKASGGFVAQGSAKDSQFESGSMDSAFAAAAAGPDTDLAQLPADWNTVEFKDLQLVQQLGAGSFGSVWLAQYCQTTVAVKVLGGDKAPGATDSVHQRSITRQLKKEAGLMSKLRHSNIVLYMGVCAEPPCLLMEHCSRKGVDELLAQGRRDPRVAKQLRWTRLLSMALDAAKGMLYLHTRSPAIFHRDLKTANLLVTSQYQVKVADFNLSRTLSNANFMSTICIQNPRWLAPEVLAGEAGGLPADCWAFGTVLWELMTWAPPFDGMNPYQIINTVQAAERGSGLAVPPQDQLPAGPFGQYAEYVALMEDCWERDPAKRPTCEEIVNRLRAMLAIEARRHSSALSSGALPSMVNSSAPSPQASIPLPRTASAPRGAPSSSNASAAAAAAAALQSPAAGQGTAGSSGASVSPFSTPTDAGISAAGSGGFSGAAEAAADIHMASPSAMSPFAAVAGGPAQHSPYSSK